MIIVLDMWTEESNMELYMGAAVEYILNKYTADRFDFGAHGPHYFQLIPIYKERGWHMIFEKTRTRISWQIVELYVNCTPTQVGLSQVNSTIHVRESSRLLNDFGVCLEQSAIHSSAHVAPHVIFPSSARTYNQNPCTVQFNPPNQVDGEPALEGIPSSQSDGKPHLNRAQRPSQVRSH
uniref:Uncharacterized protein n=1 Tax=Oryza meridionalis TaxID=40149 RepID=A0A0E0E1Q2_9ORYZ